jgi:hypothetical protein
MAYVEIAQQSDSIRGNTTTHMVPRALFLCKTLPGCLPQARSAASRPTGGVSPGRTYPAQPGLIPWLLILLGTTRQFAAPTSDSLALISDRESIACVRSVQWLA